MRSLRQGLQGRILVRQRAALRAASPLATSGLCLYFSISSMHRIHAQPFLFSTILATIFVLFEISERDSFGLRIAGFISIRFESHSHPCPSTVTATVTVTPFVRFDSLRFTSIRSDQPQSQSQSPPADPTAAPPRRCRLHVALHPAVQRARRAHRRLECAHRSRCRRTN